MNKEMRIIREVNREAEEFYPQATELGDHAAYALQRVHRSQMTGLENIADTALKTADIFDYIKRQTARFSYWQKGFPGHGDQAAQAFGLRLNDTLSNLTQRLNVLCQRLEVGNETDQDRYLRQRIYLLLIRQFIRQMVVQYEFRVTPLDRQGGK